MFDVEGQVLVSFRPSSVDISHAIDLGMIVIEVAKPNVAFDQDRIAEVVEAVAFVLYAQLTDDARPELLQKMNELRAWVNANKREDL